MTDGAAAAGARGVAGEPVIEASGLVRKFDDRAVLKGVNLTVRRGENVVILGGSGCGKSTLLRSLVGLDRPDAGSIRLFGREIVGLDPSEMDALRKRFGILFQSAALLQSLTTAENVALPLKQHTDLEESVIEIMVRLKLEMVGLSQQVNHMPAMLSGGQKKRAGLARAMSMDPEILFCDEPSAGLDPIVAAEIDELLIGLKKMMGITQVVVTHHLDSAYKIADKIVMLHEGVVVFDGSPQEYQASADPMVVQFREGSPIGPMARRATSANLLETLLGGR